MIINQKNYTIYFFSVLLLLIFSSCEEPSDIENKRTELNSLNSQLFSRYNNINKSDVNEISNVIDEFIMLKIKVDQYTENANSRGYEKNNSLWISQIDSVVNNLKFLQRDIIQKEENKKKEIEERKKFNAFLEKEEEKVKNKQLFNSLYNSIINFHPDYNQHEFLFEDGMKRTSNKEKHYFKFSELENVYIDGSSSFYSLHITDKSGHKERFIKGCSWNDNSLIDIYQSLQAYIRHKIPNCKTDFFYTQDYVDYLKHQEDEKASETKRMTHKNNHITVKNLFVNGCEFCAKTKSTYYCPPGTIRELQKYFEHSMKKMSSKKGRYPNYGRSSYSGFNISDSRIFNYDLKDIKSISIKSIRSERAFIVNSGEEGLICICSIQLTTHRGFSRKIEWCFEESRERNKNEFRMLFGDYRKMFKRRP